MKALVDRWKLKVGKILISPRWLALYASIVVAVYCLVKCQVVTQNNSIHQSDFNLIHHLTLAGTIPFSLVALWILLAASLPVQASRIILKTCHFCTAFFVCTIWGMLWGWKFWNNGEDHPWHRTLAMTIWIVSATLGIVIGRYIATITAAKFRADVSFVYGVCRKLSYVFVPTVILPSIQFWSVVGQRKKVVCIGAVAGVVFGTAIVLLTKPIYSATCHVLFPNGF